MLGGLLAGGLPGVSGAAHGLVPLPSSSSRARGWELSGEPRGEQLRGLARAGSLPCAGEAAARCPEGGRPETGWQGVSVKGHIVFRVLQAIQSPSLLVSAFVTQKQPQTMYEGMHVACPSKTTYKH